MPTYDYECISCEHTFEAFQSMSEEPLKKCPECGKKVRRLIGGGIGIIFKGSGFYATDSKSGSGKSSKDSEGKKQEGESASASASPEAKSDTSEKADKKGKSDKSDKSEKKDKKDSQKTA